MAYPSIEKTYAQTKYNVTKKAGRTVSYIAVHYTGTTASAKNNCKYFSGGNRNASADYFIDTDGSIWQFNADPKNYYAWAVGDGKGKYGITNANSISIEVVSAGAEFTSAQKDALKNLVGALMADYGMSASNVVRHYDASRKTCPAPYAGTSAKDAKWKTLHAYITGGSVSSSSSATSTSKVIYRVRKTWSDAKSQIGAYSVLANAKDLADKNSGYSVFDENGNVVYAGKTSTTTTTTTTTAATSSSTSASTSYDKTPDTVKEVQIYMNKVYGSGLAEDGSFGKLTKAAIVKQVQKIIGTTVDGSFGSNSKSKWGSRVIKKGSSGSLARLCQMILICRGYSVGSAGADADFGANSVAAVKRFQKAHGLSQDGVIGKNTAAKLFA